MSAGAVRIVLASGSPTRRDLLARVVARFDVVEPHVDERACAQPDVRGRALALAEAKARDVAARRPGTLVIGADTVVACRGEVIGKPADRDDAVRILRALTRSPHEVVTGLCVIAPDGRVRRTCVGATLHMRPMSDEEIEALADAPGTLDRAGAYALQTGDPNVLQLEGSETAVMGLPLDELTAMLAEFCPALGGRDGAA